MLARAQELASRFATTGAELDSLQTGVTHDLRNGIAAVNQLTQRIADVNEQISRTVGSGQPPNDLLDLRDLLQGEAKAGVSAGNLQNYLDFDTTTSAGNTIIHVSSTGGFAGGVYSAAAEDQRIVLTGVDVRSVATFGLTSTATDNDIINQLLQRGKLITDGG